MAICSEQLGSSVSHREGPRGLDQHFTNEKRNWEVDRCGRQAERIDFELAVLASPGHVADTKLAESATRTSHQCIRRYGRIRVYS